MSPEPDAEHLAEYARRIHVVPGPGVIDAYRLVTRDHPVTVTIMPYFSEGRHAYRAELYDRDSGAYQQWSSFDGATATVDAARSVLARYMAEHLGAPT